MIETFFFKLSSQQQEVEDLTVKLDALRNKEKTLLHKKTVQNGTIHNDSSDDSAPSSPSPLRSGATSTSSYGDVIPSSPLRAHFRAYLPNNQRTMVSVNLFLCTVFTLLNAALALWCKIDLEKTVNIRETSSNKWI